MPPSRPTTSARSLPSASSANSGAAAVGSSTSSRLDAARVARDFVEASGRTSGSQARNDCVLASRTMHLQRLWPVAILAPSQRTRERCAAQGMTPSTPSSVAAWMASSSRSPFARASGRARSPRRVSATRSGRSGPRLQRARMTASRCPGSGTQEDATSFDTRSRGLPMPVWAAAHAANPVPEFPSGRGG